MLFYLTRSCVIYEFDRENGWTWTWSQCLSSSSGMVSREYTFIIYLLLNVILLTGTVISLQSSYESELTFPISQRLRSRNTVLTKTADPSLLVHALLDLSMRLTLIETFKLLIRYHSVVDKALQVIDEYHTTITNLEHDILLKPKMSRVRKCTLLCCRAITFY